MDCWTISRFWGHVHSCVWLLCVCVSAESIPAKALRNAACILCLYQILSNSFLVLFCPCPIPTLTQNASSTKLANNWVWLKQWKQEFNEMPLFKFISKNQQWNSHSSFSHLLPLLAILGSLDKTAEYLCSISGLSVSANSSSANQKSRMSPATTYVHFTGPGHHFKFCL